MKWIEYLNDVGQKRDVTIDYLRGLALVSVVCAHCSGLYNPNELITERIAVLLNNVGSIGVPVFLFISGLFDHKQPSIKSLLLGLKRIIIPWAIFGSLVWCYMAIRGDAIAYIDWMLGNGSYLYYLPVLLALKSIFYLINGNTRATAVIVILSIIMNIAVEADLVQINNYLNVLFWAVWFGTGVLARTQWAKINSSIRKYGWISLALFVLLLSISIAGKYRVDAYFDHGYIIYEALAVIGLIWMANTMSGGVSSLIRYCGINSLPFYLIHMPFAGIVSRLCYMIDIPGVDVLRVPLTYLVTFVMIETMRLITVSSVISGVVSGVKSQPALSQSLNRYNRNKRTDGSRCDRMAFRANESQQVKMDDTFLRLTKREQKLLEKSWAAYFGKYIFPKINETPFSVLYSEDAAFRPNTPVKVIIGALHLKSMFGLTDEELLESVLFDVRFQYALHTTSYDEQPMSDRTLSRFRERLAEYYDKTEIDLFHDEIEALSAEHVKLMKIDTRVKRMDSMSVSDNCRKMGRLTLVYECVSQMAVAAHRLGCEELLVDGLMGYIEDAEKTDPSYRLKEEEVESTLTKYIKDAFRLVLACVGHEELTELPEYRRLNRLLSKQTEISVEPEISIRIRQGKELRADNLQNPSDEEATYRVKGGKRDVGYVANLVEDVAEGGSEIITSYDVAHNITADTTFTEEVLEELGQ